MLLVSLHRHVIGGSIGWVEELDDDLYLGSGENLCVLFVALGYHGGPHAAGVVHLATEEAQGRLVRVVGVVELCQFPERVGFDYKFVHVFLFNVEWLEVKG